MVAGWYLGLRCDQTFRNFRHEMRKIHLLFGLGLLLPLTALAWWQGWFASEPVYHGRTVTDWLDAMAIYDEMRSSDETGQHSWNDQRTPEAIAADPAMQALLALGPKGVPALRAVLRTPPAPPSRWRQINHRFRVLWTRLWDPTYPAYSPLSPPAQYSSLEEARIMSAGLTLLALGTNHDAGLPVLFEEYTRRYRSTSQPILPFPAYRAIGTALSGLPQLRAEMQEVIDKSLTHTDPLYRHFAARNALLRWFPEEFPHWHPLLLLMAASDQEDRMVRDGAMFALLVQSPTNDPEFVTLCTQILTNRANPKLLRARATGGLRFGGSSNAIFLSAIRAATNDSDSYVQQSARTALRDFEKHPQQ